MKVQMQKLAQMGSEKSDQGNVQKNEQMTPETEICNVKTEKCGNGYEKQCPITPNGQKNKPIFHFRIVRSSKKNGQKKYFWSQNLKF